MKTEDKKVWVMFFLCLFLFITNIIAVSLYYKEKNKFKAIVNNNPYPLLDFSRNFKEQKDFIVNLKDLRFQLNELVDQSNSFEISMYLEFLNSGANISINPESRIFPASLTKIPVAMLIMKKIELGQLTLDQKIKIEEEDRDSKWGEIYKAPEGTQLKIEELLSESIRNSDNTAHNILYRLIMPEDVAILEEELGLEELFDADGKMSAKEYSRVFRSLYTSSFLQKDNSQYLLMLLSTTSYNNYLGAGLREGTVYAHKFGEKKSEGVFSESGIVYLKNRPYLITVCIKSREQFPKDVEKNKSESLEIMKIISSKVFSYFDNEN